MGWPFGKKEKAPETEAGATPAADTPVTAQEQQASAGDDAPAKKRLNIRFAKIPKETLSDMAKDTLEAGGFDTAEIVAAQEAARRALEEKKRQDSDSLRDAFNAAARARPAATPPRPRGPSP